RPTTLGSGITVVAFLGPGGQIHALLHVRIAGGVRLFLSGEIGAAHGSVHHSRKCKSRQPARFVSVNLPPRLVIWIVLKKIVAQDSPAVGAVVILKQGG